MPATNTRKTHTSFEEEQHASIAGVRLQNDRPQLACSCSLQSRQISRQMLQRGQSTRRMDGMPATNTHTITDTFKGKSSVLRLRAFVCKTMHHSPSGAGLPRPQPSTRQWRLCIRPAAPLGLWCIMLQTNARNRSALLLSLKMSVIVSVFVAGIPSVRRVDWLPHPG